MNRLHRHLPTVFLALTIPVVAIYWVGLAASHRMDYKINSFTFADALKRTAEVNLSDLFHDDLTASQLWFVPFALLIAGLYFGSKRLHVAALAAGLAVPFCTFTPGIGLLAVTLPLFILGSPDGEDWGEAWLALSAVGTWTLLAVFALIGDLVLRNRSKHVIHPTH